MKCTVNDSATLCHNSAVGTAGVKAWSQEHNDPFEFSCCVFRDLAARNCLVMGDHTLKIGDYGIAEDLFKVSGITGGYGTAGDLFKVSGITGGYGTAGDLFKVSGITGSYGTAGDLFKVSGIIGGYAMARGSVQSEWHLGIMA